MLSLLLGSLRKTESLKSVKSKLTHLLMALAKRSPRCRATLASHIVSDSCGRQAWVCHAFICSEFVRAARHSCSCARWHMQGWRACRKPVIVSKQNKKKKLAGVKRGGRNAREVRYKSKGICVSYNRSVNVARKVDCFESECVHADGRAAWRVCMQRAGNN